MPFTMSPRTALWVIPEVHRIMGVRGGVFVRPPDGGLEQILRAMFLTLSVGVHNDQWQYPLVSTISFLLLARERLR
jgi:hypothetical protein